MQYLQDQQYYEDRYDLLTIELCLSKIDFINKVAKDSLKSPEIQNTPIEEINKGWNQVLHEQLLDIKLHRYKQRETEINEWINEDKLRQDKYDNTSAPAIKCTTCKKLMTVKLKTLDWHDTKPQKMLFFLECPVCKERKHIFEDGTEWIHEPELCPKCKSEVKRSYERKGDIVTTTIKCTSCSYKDVEVDDYKKDEEERLQKKQTEKELLEKYRPGFCLSKEKGEELLDGFEQLKFMNEVYEYELQKHQDPVYEKTFNIKRLTIIELEKLLNRKLVKYKFKKLILDKPEITRFVIVPFSVQDNDANRNNKNSTKELEKIIKETLEITNWRLTPDGTSYRLGYISGRLKGYERDEDLHELFGKKKEDPKAELDLEKLSKYSNTAEIARLFAKVEITERLRKKRLEKEPEGFFLDDRESGYSCNLCSRGLKGSESWWNLDGIQCIDCRRNVKEGIIPAEIIKNHDLWIANWQFKSEFRLHSATVSKMKRNGELVGRELKDLEGKTYFTVCMVEDNKKFFKKHRKTSSNNRKWEFVDKDGIEILL